MPAPTGIIAFSPTTPAATSGRLNVVPQTDNGSPIQRFSFNIPNGGGGGVEYRTTTTESLGQADQGKVISFSNASAIAVGITTPTDPGWKVAVFITGTGAATFTPASGTINGAASLVMTSGQNCVIWWDGTNYVAALGGGPGTTLVLETNGTPNASQTTLNLIGGTGITLTDGGSGNITIAQSSGGAGPTPSTRRWAYGGPTTSGMTTQAGAWCGGENAGSSGTTQSFEAAGAVGFFNQPVASYANVTSGSSAGLQSNWISSTSGWTVVGKNMLFQTRIALSAITSIRARIGVGAISSISNWISADSVTTIARASFRFSTGVPDTNWQCETCDGAATNVADSGIAVVAATLYTLQIKFNDATPNVVFSINGTVVYTSTSHLPASGTGLSFADIICPLTNSSKTLFVGWVYEEADN